MLEPKLFFDNVKELQECAKEWKERLHLQDWFITVRFCDVEEFSDPEYAGQNNTQWVNKCSAIIIRKKEDFPTSLMIKEPQELVLIHELMHCKIIGFEEKSREEAVYEIKQHQLIEEMAKSLYMAKYGINHKWFYNGGD